MMSLAEEIQAISEKAEQCVNYPIGEKLTAFIKQQDESKPTNYILSGVLIFAASKIYGRKVDYLEQEIMGISKNFKAVEASDETQPEVELKKRRTKKFTLKDRVSTEKVTFEEKPITVLTKIDINKTLAIPSKINRLQKIKEFFTKNKSRTGKLVIPKSLLFAGDYVMSNFGATQIHDYDDYKDIVGSRRDFTSFSYFINEWTGELQSDMTTNNGNSDDDFHFAERENLDNCDNISIPSTPKDRFLSPVDWATRPNTPAIFREPSAEVESLTVHHELEALKLNHEMETLKMNREEDYNINIDEGIEMDEVERASMLLPIQPMVKLIDMRVKSPALFPSDIQVNDSLDMNGFDRSVLTVQHELTNNISDFDLPDKLKNEANIKNLFLIPLKKLKHKCIFDLPNAEFGELKKRKREQHKKMGVEVPLRQMKPFKTLDILIAQLNAMNDGEPTFLGFTKEMQQEPMTSIKIALKEKPFKEARRSRSRSPLTEGRKLSNDSGLGSDCTIDTSISLIGDQTTLPGTANTTSEDEDRSEYFDALDAPFEDSDNNINMSGGDSCYQSLSSGSSSGKTELSSFFKDIESRNETINANEEVTTNQVLDESLNESEERVQLMKQSAINIAKWKEYLKPILANSEDRSKIDMHQYGIEMIDKIGNVNDTVTFDSINVEGKTPAYFFTMLQLTNNRNIDIEFGERSMTEPVNARNIKITLKSKVMHQEKFNEMGQQFIEEEDKKKKKNLKRKAVQTSTPAKRLSIQGESSLSFNNLDASDSMDEGIDNAMLEFSQATSGYCSQTSVLSDF